MDAHAQCLRNEQCTCTYDLNKTRWPPDGVQNMFDEVSDETMYEKLLAKS